MTLIAAPVIASFIATPPSALASSARRRRPRAGALLAIGAALSSLLIASYAPDTQAKERRGRTAKAARAEDNGGNPQFYEVFGKRYRVRASSDGYSERGMASWYGRPFHGRPTSSGEMYDMNEMTAAHTTLPLPTWVEVTNLANGKRIVVKVNDRGPFVGKRVIDLSYAAATKLDIVGPGTALVEVRALPGPPAKTTAARRADRRETPADARVATARTVERSVTPAKRRAASPTVAAAAAQAQSERLFAEAGRFRQRADATELIAALKAEGFVNAFVVTEDRRRKSVHRVRVGPLPGEADVERVERQLRELGARRSHSVVMP